MKRLHQLRLAGVQLNKTLRNQLLNQRRTFDGKVNVYLPGIGRRAIAQDQAKSGKPVCQFYRAVMPDPESFRQHQNRWLQAFRKAAQREKHHVLLRPQSSALRNVIAHREKFSDLAAEFSQGLIVFILQAHRPINLYRSTIYNSTGWRECRF